MTLACNSYLPLHLTFLVLSMLILSLAVYGVFYDLSKAFDRVWYDDLLYKIKSNRTDDNLVKLIKSFLNDRSNWVILKVWKLVTFGVLQGSVLGPLFFLISSSDLPFVDDTSLFSVVNKNSVSASKLNNDLVQTRDYAFIWRLWFNPGPTKQAKEVIFPTKNSGVHPSLFFNKLLFEPATTQKYLGFTLDHKLTFQYRVNKENKKTTLKETGLLQKLQPI